MRSITSFAVTFCALAAVAAAAAIINALLEVSIAGPFGNVANTESQRASLQFGRHAALEFAGRKTLRPLLQLAGLNPGFHLLKPSHCLCQTVPGLLAEE